MSQKSLGLLSRKSFRELCWKIAVYTIISVGGIVLMIPIFWMLSTALKEPSQIFVIPPQWIPRPMVWYNFVEALTSLDFSRYFLNTTIIAVASMIGTVFSTSLVAFGFARLRGPGRDLLFIVVLSTMMIPIHVVLIPRFIIFRYLGWIDTYLPLIVPTFVASSPFYVFLLRQFFMTIPLELDDSAKIDGCGPVGIYWRIMLPLSKPALVTVAIFTFMFNWNDFVQPLIYLSSMDNRTLSLGLMAFKDYYIVEWNLLMAASLVVVLPCLVLFFFAQKYFIQGIVITGVKG